MFLNIKHWSFHAELTDNGSACKQHRKNMDCFNWAVNIEPRCGEVGGYIHYSEMDVFGHPYLLDNIILHVSRLLTSLNAILIISKTV